MDIDISSLEISINRIKRDLLEYSYVIRQLQDDIYRLQDEVRALQSEVNDLKRGY